MRSRAAAQRYGTRALLCALLVVLSSLPAGADAGTSVTAGGDGFVYQDLNAGVDLSSATSAGIFAARFSDDFTPQTLIYSADLALELRSLSLGAVGYYSPDAGGFRYYGAQANAGYRGKGRDLDWSAVAGFGRTLNTFGGAPLREGQVHLHDNVLNVALSGTFRKTVALRYSYIFHDYQENPVPFFYAQFGPRVVLPSAVYTLLGYPSRESQAGISWYPDERWALTLDWKRLLFEMFAVRQSSVIWGATWYPGRSWGISVGYNLINGSISYYSLGIQWYARGHERGTEERPPISYNNLP